MSSRLLTYRGVVYPWQCDHMGHMNVMWYVGKFDEATWNLFLALGLTPTFLRENGRGVAAVEQVISYKKELLAGETVSVFSGVVEVKERVLRFLHEMHNGETDELVATTLQTTVHIDAVARKAVALPADVAAKAREFTTSS